MTVVQPPEPSPPPDSRTAPAAEELLETVHWHLLRGDHLRSGIASRASAVLSTNALVIGGIALALSLRSQRPSAALVVIAVAALSCTVISVSNAALALMSVRSNQPLFEAPGTRTSFLYSYAEIDETHTFEEFKRHVMTASPDEILEFALVELWRCRRLQGYRYTKLRSAIRWLLAALVFFLAAAAASALR